MNRRFSFSLRLVVLAVAAVPQSAWAHNLIADVNPSVEPIRVLAYYDDDTPAEGARVSVLDANEATVAAGVCDEKGVWRFPRPGPGKYRIIAEQAGHRSDPVVLDVPEAAPPLAISRWRLDKHLGLAIGLGIILGGTGLYMLVRYRLGQDRSAPK